MLRPSIAVPSSEITPRETYARRREFLRLSAGIALTGILPGAQGKSLAGKSLAGKSSTPSTTGTPTPLPAVTSYNNF